MEIEFVRANDENFSPTLYLKVLVAIAKSDRYNGPPETEYVKDLARRLSVDFVEVWNETGKNFDLASQKVSRLTALLLIKDCIVLASMDGNFSLDEKQRVYRYAANMDIPRSDVDVIQDWLDDYQKLRDKWKHIVAGHSLA